MNNFQLRKMTTIAGLLLCITLSFIARNAIGIECPIPPIAASDSAVVSPGEQVIIDVLANDRHDFGVPLTITQVSNNGCNGFAQIGGGGAYLIFTADDGFVGPCTLSYEVSTREASATASVWLSGGIGPLEILVHPVSQDIHENDPFDFYVVVTGGEEPYSYQWQYFFDDMTEWADLGDNPDPETWDGETTATLQVFHADPIWDGAQVRCKVWDVSGENNAIYSSPASLTVLPPSDQLHFIVHPVTELVLNNGHEEYTAKVVGGDAYAFVDWQMSSNGQAWSPLACDEHCTANVVNTFNDDGCHTVESVLYMSFGPGASDVWQNRIIRAHAIQGALEAFSHNAVIQFLDTPAPEIDPGYPQDLTVVWGGTAYFSVAGHVTGAEPLGYSWVIDGYNPVLIAQEDTWQFNVAAIAPLPKTVAVWVWDAYDQATRSRDAVLRIAPAVDPVAPATQTVCLGKQAQLSVTASAHMFHELSYQWFHNGAPMIAPDSPTLSIGAAQPSDAGTYSCRVTVLGDNGASTMSAAATLLVTECNDAVVVSHTIPDTMIAGESYEVSVTMLNNGSTTWTRAEYYKLGAVGGDPFTSFTRVLLDPDDIIKPGDTKTFSFTMTAPAAGPYVSDWRMLRELVEWFGQTASQSIEVEALELLVNPSFEDGGGWGQGATAWSNWSATFAPGTSFFRASGGMAQAHEGSFGYSISNQPYGNLRSSPVSVAEGTTYELTAWIRGELDEVGTEKGWLVRAEHYNANGDRIGQSDVASSSTVTTTWQQVGGTYTTPAGTVTSQVALFLYQAAGWVCFDDLALHLDGDSTNLLENPGFEDGGGAGALATGWTEVANTFAPATSFFRAKAGMATPRSGTYGYSISNQAYGSLRSEMISVSPATTYDLTAWVRGEIDPVGTAAGYLVRAEYFDANNVRLGSLDVAGGISVTKTWQQVGGPFTTPTNTASVRIRLYLYQSSGWIAFDNIVLSPDGGVTNLVANPGFETADGWVENPAGFASGTSFLRSTWGMSKPYQGSYAYSISNQVYGFVHSDPIAVEESTTYRLTAWLRGEIDLVGSERGWLVRVAYYDTNGSYFANTDVAKGDTPTTTWEQVGGELTTPPGTVSIEVRLYMYQATGWVAFDDLHLYEVIQ